MQSRKCWICPRAGEHLRLQLYRENNINPEDLYAGDL